MSPSFDTLYYEGTSNTLNAAFSSAYNSTIANGANAQVLFREASTPSFTLTLPSAQVSKIYGQADPTLANLRTAVQTVYTAGSGATTLTTDVNAAGGGSNTFGLSAAEAMPPSQAPVLQAKTSMAVRPMRTALLSHHSTPT